MPTAQDLARVGDITHIKTFTGRAFLATVIDCYARRVVGFAVAEHMRTDLIIDAPRMAIVHREGSSFIPTEEANTRARNSRLLSGHCCATVGRAHRQPSSSDDSHSTLLVVLAARAAVPDDFAPLGRTRARMKSIVGDPLPSRLESKSTAMPTDRSTYKHNSLDRYGQLRGLLDGPGRSFTRRTVSALDSWSPGPDRPVSGR